jgi:hypothetical protein
MIRDLYADNYQERRQETFLRAAGRCENKTVDENGQVLWRCPNRLGTFKISRAHNPCFEQLYIHHTNDDPENPHAEMIVVCASCHMKLHRKPDTNGKTPAKKRGYPVVSIKHVLICLTSAGFSVQPNETCRVSWRIGPLQGEAADPLDAICMAMHWLGAEVRDLEDALAEQRRLTDTLIRTNQAEERRLRDSALRQEVRA